MANNFDRETRKQHWEYTARKPRHEAAETSGLELRLEDNGQVVGFGELLDCSRTGMRFQASDSVAAGSALIVHFSAPSENIDWATPAILRWCQANATGWECGCEFEEELPWEQLGQLLLGGYLSME